MVHGQRRCRRICFTKRSAVSEAVGSLNQNDQINEPRFKTVYTLLRKTCNKVEVEGDMGHGAAGYLQRAEQASGRSMGGFSASTHRARIRCGPP